MARARAQSLGDSLKTPHTVSLKVLRLTRPSLTQQFPIPQSQNTGVSQIVPTFSSEPSLAYPNPSSDPKSIAPFILTPLLTLPESFQSAYVGELFSCTLCANNELTPEESKTRMVSGVRIVAEIVSPSNQSGTVLEFQPSPNDESSKGFGPGDSMQRILRFNLQEEGEHTLAVTVTYTETTMTGAGEGRASVAAGGRVRTFRKLYQFVAASLISVRTKAGDLVDGRYALEAQLENLGAIGVVLENVRMNAKAPFKATSLNWDIGGEGSYPPLLNPRDIMQVAFLLEETKEEEEEEEDDTAQTEQSQTHTRTSSGGAADTRFILGQLNVQWRSAMGDKGSITTGYLTGRKR